MALPRRVLIDLSPMVFATALARILRDRGYQVDIGANGHHHDLAVVADGASGDAAVEIALASLDGPQVTAQVTDAHGCHPAEVRDLGDLLRLIEEQLPID